MTRRLSRAAIKDLPATVTRPGYQPGEHGVGIVHLGVGAFHRAHQAAYVDRALALDGGDWRVRGVSLRSPGVRDRLAPQDNFYTRVERSAAGDRVHLTGSIAQVLVAPENPEAVIRAIADPKVHIVSLTITEKGYCHDPATGELDEDHPDVVHDLDNRDNPRSALGFLAAGLALRSDMEIPAPTLLCCDNLPDNGQVLARTLTRYAALADQWLAEWIEADASFPSTMVDRIVPAVTQEDIGRLTRRIGVEDRGMVKTEPFTQWVIEDCFTGPRPALERVGAQLVPDVRPFELAKLRMLNGAHSTLAYLGLRLEIEFVHEAVRDEDLRIIVEHLMRGEAAATLPAAADLSPAGYATALLDRFANPALEHRLFQIAMDGSQKLPQRLLGTIRDRLSAGQSVDAALLGVAGWMLHATGRGPDGTRHEVDDPLAATLAAVTDRCGLDPSSLAHGMLGVTSIFGDLGQRPAVTDALTAHLDGLIRSPRGWLHHIAVLLRQQAAA